LTREGELEGRQVGFGGKGEDWDTERMDREAVIEGWEAGI
jgi:hypothetical protein